MDPDTLFLATLDDLDASAIAGRTSYDLLHVAALLRKLLLDGTSLLDSVNRSRRVKIRFHANHRQPPDDPAPTSWSIQDGLDPDTAAPLRRNNIVELGRDAFLGVTIIVHDGVRLSVADVVRYVANVAGGVHLGTPTGPKEVALASLGQSMRVGGYPPELRSLLSVARVVSKALQPLRDAIENERSSGTE